MNDMIHSCLLYECFIFSFGCSIDKYGNVTLSCSEVEYWHLQNISAYLSLELSTNIFYSMMFFPTIAFHRSSVVNSNFGIIRKRFMFVFLLFQVWEITSSFASCSGHNLLSRQHPDINQFEQTKGQNVHKIQTHQKSSHRWIDVNIGYSISVKGENILVKMPLHLNKALLDKTFTQ